MAWVAGLLALSLAAAACGRDRSGGPKGAPDDVVHAAPDITTHQRSARVTVDTPTATSAGTIVFPTTQQVRVNGAGASEELGDPVSVLDLVRGAVDIVPYGGAEVRGASTIRYSFDVDLDVAALHAPTAAARARIEQAKAALGRPTFYADVWVDSAGRVRRVQVPVDRRDKRPGYKDVVLERLVTVDFYDYNRTEGKG